MLCVFALLAKSPARFITGISNERRMEDTRRFPTELFDQQNITVLPRTEVRGCSPSVRLSPAVPSHSKQTEIEFRSRRP